MLSSCAADRISLVCDPSTGEAAIIVTECAQASILPPACVSPAHGTRCTLRM